MTTMTSSTQTLTDKTNSNLTLLIQWFSKGWALFLNAPFKIFGCLFAVMVVSGLFQILPAPIGLLVSKWVGAMLIAAVWPMIDQLTKTQRFSFKGLSAYSGWKYLPLVALVLMLPFALQIGVASIMLGNDGLQLTLFGEIGSATRLHIAVIFASSAPLIILLNFVPACLLLGGDAPVSAITNSVKMVLRAWQPMLVLLIVNALVLFLAPFTFVLSALLVGPLLVCVNYCAYQSLQTI